MDEPWVAAARRLTFTWSSRRPLSMARMAVMILVVLAGAFRSRLFFSYKTVPVLASMSTAARAFIWGGGAAGPRPGCHPQTDEHGQEGED
jgi:hypothetical protein